MLGVVACSGNSGDATDGGFTGDDIGGDDTGGDDGGVDMELPGDAPPVDTCPTDTWCVETSTIPAGTTLRALHVRAATDVLAVGDGGTIIRRQNNVWSPMISGTTKNLMGVWAASANDAWAVGDDGTVLRWNGSTWSQMEGAPNIDYYGIWGASASHVVLIGASSARTWNGTMWTGRTITGSPTGVHGTSATDVWVSAENAGLSHYDGGWSTVDTGAGTILFATYAVSPTDVWISGGGNDTTHFFGGTWTAKSAGGAVFTDFYATASNDVWGVFQTKIGRWNGSAWSVAVPPGNTANLNAIDGASGHIWVVGTNATILHRSN